jgi:hypothetical protein
MFQQVLGEIDSKHATAAQQNICPHRRLSCLTVTAQVPPGKKTVDAGIVA